MAEKWPGPAGGAAEVAPLRPPLGVACRLFGMTTKTPGAFFCASPGGVKHRDVLNKLRSSLLDWRPYRQQQADERNVNRP